MGLDSGGGQPVAEDNRQVAPAARQIEHGFGQSAPEVRALQIGGAVPRRTLDHEEGVRQLPPEAREVQFRAYGVLRPGMGELEFQHRLRRQPLSCAAEPHACGGQPAQPVESLVAHRLPLTHGRHPSEADAAGPSRRVPGRVPARRGGRWRPAKPRIPAPASIAARPARRAHRGSLCSDS